MRTRWLLLPLSLFPLFLASCGNSGTGGGPGTGGTGPFDANGNYVESWADSPSKWKKGGRSGSDASPDQAEIVALQAPLMGGRSASSSRGGFASSTPVTPVTQPPITVRPPATIASNQPKPRPQVRSSDDDEDRPKPKSKAAVAQTTTKNSKGKGKTQVASNTTKSKTTTKESSKTTKGSTASKTTTKPKPVAVKVKPKPATSSRYAVRQGDSLYAIAKRYGTTASAIQKANGMSGTTIRPGQSLTIPKK
ncbi:MAG: lytic transglycosylase [Akkermansiaceae bacterium]|nr:lytic transglycosylase [Akkermansiaceae bacterium]